MKFPDIDPRFFSQLEQIKRPRLYELMIETLHNPKILVSATRESKKYTKPAQSNIRRNRFEYFTIIIVFSFLFVQLVPVFVHFFPELLLLTITGALLLRYYFISKQRLEKSYKNRAATVGLDYNSGSEKNPATTLFPFSAPRQPISYPGVIFSIGHSKNITSKFEYNGADAGALSIFNYNFTKGSGKYSRTYFYSVLVFNFGKEVPHILIDNVEKGLFGSKKESIPTFKDKKYTIELEGDFNKYFTIYSAFPKKAEVLTMLTPDVMEQLKLHATEADIELIDKHLVVAIPRINFGSESPISKFDTLVEIAKLITTSLQSNVKHYKLDLPKIERNPSYIGPTAARNLLIVATLTILYAVYLLL